MSIKSNMLLATLLALPAIVAATYASTFTETVYITAPCTAVSSVALPPYPTGSSNASLTASASSSPYEIPPSAFDVSVSSFTTLSSGPAATLTSATTTTAPFISAIGNCHADNCLRQFLQNPTVLASCATYTTTANAFTTGLPTYVSMCTSTISGVGPDPSRISSACACVTGYYPPPSATASLPETTAVREVATESSAEYSVEPTVRISSASAGITSISGSTCPSASLVFETRTTITTVVIVSTIEMGQLCRKCK